MISNQTSYLVIEWFGALNLFIIIENLSVQTLSNESQLQIIVFNFNNFFLSTLKHNILSCNTYQR